jgi:predicted RNA-binding Zn-ribbon protein involved in translation (DUF1610 family)
MEQEARVYEPFGKAFPFADIHVANHQCSSRNRTFLDDCPECGDRILLHCESCKIQVNGCTCTDTILHGRDYAMKAAALRPTGTAGGNRAKRRADLRKRNRTLWTPNQMHRD